MLILARALDPDAVTLINRMTAPPTRRRADQISETIRRLKDVHIWPKLDLVQFLAAHTSQAALLNWKSTSFTGSVVNAPTFVADTGYTTNGTNNYVSTGYDQATAGNLFVRDSAYFGIWLMDDTASNAAVAGFYDGTDGVTITHDDGTGNHLAGGRINQAANSAGANNSGAGRGLWGISRSAGSVGAVRRNGVDRVTVSVASVAVNSGNALRLGSITAAIFAARTFGGAFAGQNLTAAEEVLLYTITRDYMLAAGNSV